MMQQELEHKCPVCGNMVTQWTRFCPECGARLNNSSVQSARIITAKEESQSPRRSFLGRIYRGYKALLAIIVLATDVLILLLYKLTRNFDNSVDPTLRLLYVALGFSLFFFMALILTLIFR